MDALTCRTSGSGPDFVLVHGYLGGAGMWDQQLPFFSQHFRCIAPNLAGFGDSARLQAPDTIEGHAHQVLHTLDQLGVERFHLLGHSMGGMVVQQMAAIAPQRIKRLVLYGTGPVGLLPIGSKASKAPGSGSPPMVSPQRRSASRRPGSKKVLKPRTTRPASARAPRQRCRRRLQACRRGRRGTARPRFRASPCRRSSFGETETDPTAGASRRPFGVAYKVAAAVVAGCAHNVHMEKPHIFNAIVRDFLEMI